jgi:hypothetical protein
MFAARLLHNPVPLQLADGLAAHKRPARHSPIYMTASKKAAGFDLHRARATYLAWKKSAALKRSVKPEAGRTSRGLSPGCPGTHYSHYSGRVRH